MVTSNDANIPDGLEFLWLELTAKCNLQCIHCYAESSPTPSRRDLLVLKDYQRILHEAACLGCRSVQFIGGEPTIVPYLPDLIAYACAEGFNFVEVYSNLTHITAPLLDCFRDYGVKVATSFYSWRPEIHDAITGKAGSHDITVQGIKKVIAGNLALRAGITLMPQNQLDLNETLNFLKSLGIAEDYIRIDQMRSFGRASVEMPVKPTSDLGELCGSCWRGSICIAPDGLAFPCIMSRNLPVGSVLASSLADVVKSSKLGDLRKRIYDAIWLPQQMVNRAGTVETEIPMGCNPNCSPSCQPVCSPRCSPVCSPQSCSPMNKCNPELYCNPCGPDSRR